MRVLNASASTWYVPYRIQILPSIRTSGTRNAQHRRAGLGEEFLSSVDACLECIGVDLVCTLSHPDFTFDKDFGYAECTGPGVICKQQAQGSDRCVHFRHNLPLLVVVLLIKHVFIDGVSRFLPLLSDQLKRLYRLDYWCPVGRPEAFCQPLI